MRITLSLLSMLALTVGAFGQGTGTPKAAGEPTGTGVSEIVTAGLTRPQIDLSSPEPRYADSAEALKKMFPSEAEQARLMKEINFDKQTVIVFAWQGSGGDVLTYKGYDDQTKVATFTLKVGLTEDVRRHFKMYVAPKGVTARTAPAANLK